jgi:hypothetical protein
MYVCMYLCVLKCGCIYGKYKYIQFLRTNDFKCMYACYVFMFVCLYVCMCVYMAIRLCMYVCVQVHGSSSEEGVGGSVHAVRYDCPKLGAICCSVQLRRRWTQSARFTYIHTYIHTYTPTFSSVVFCILIMIYTYIHTNKQSLRILTVHTCIQYIHTYIHYMTYTNNFDVSVMEKSDRPVDYGNISGKETSDFDKLEDGLSSTD